MHSSSLGLPLRMAYTLIASPPTTVQFSSSKYGSFTAARLQVSGTGSGKVRPDARILGIRLHMRSKIAKFNIFSPSRRTLFAGITARWSAFILPRWRFDACTAEP